MELEIHAVQGKILTSLLLMPQARFSELNKEKLENDHFNFHLKRLVQLRLITKDTNGYYTLTAKGKEFANRFDTVNAQVERQAKVGLVVIATKTENGKEYILFQQRLKHPYYGYLGFITGKIRWGETLTEAAARELLEETGLVATLRLIGIEHKMDYTQEENLLEDKFFYVFHAIECTGSLVENYEGGANTWVEKAEVANLSNTFDDIEELIQWLNSNELSFVENKFIVNGY
jgi:ADP-ribose pyrophosphatase YjhB (NUDIX family)